MKERKELMFGINIEVTTEIKKKGVLAYQGAPQRKTRADYSFRKRGGGLQLKSTNPLQGTEQCSWPKINLAVPFSQEKKILRPIISLTSECRKVLFIPCKDWDH